MISSLILTSQQDIKVKAVKRVFGDTITLTTEKVSSDIPEQPFGFEQIKQGAYNRIRNLPYYPIDPIISLETGIVDYDDEYCQDITYCVISTRWGVFEGWSEPFKFPKKVVENWKKFLETGPARSFIGTKPTTVGQYVDPDDNHDWYHVRGYSRLTILCDCIKRVASEFVALYQSIDPKIIPASMSKFNDVDFLDIQYSLIHYSYDIMKCVKRLSEKIVFDTVLVLDARGFLFVGEFAREKVPIVLCRKSGKLPNEGLRVEYQKEYGVDVLCISKDAIQKNARVLVVDDLIATGGTMLAAEKLVQMAGGEVVAFVAPYAIEVPNGQLLSKTDLLRTRFLCTHLEANKYKQCRFCKDHLNCVSRTRVTSKTCACYDLKNQINSMLTMSPQYSFIIPPSMLSVSRFANVHDIYWGNFKHSSNIWLPMDFSGKDVIMILDTSNYKETMELLQIVKIMYRKHLKNFQIVIPFIEQATQDRIEYKKDYESLACIDTLPKLIGNIEVITFDIHALQSQFCFYNIHNWSMVEKLYTKFRTLYPNAIVVFPDDGAKKRFAEPLGSENAICYQKMRRGDERIVNTNDEILKGKSYVIIDDLVRSGGTMKSVAQDLYHHGATEVYALFAHAPFEHTTARNLSLFTDIWTSDTCPRFVPSKWIKCTIADFFNLE